jgi:hypothetical protein|tara:strand:+ start:4031 stop:4207 length:177 start_codon:yes stop_codon:yes gene_type:complete
METLEKIKSLVETLTNESTKFYEKGNKSAATRARSSAQELRELLKTFRGEILESKKND